LWERSGHVIAWRYVSPFVPQSKIMPDQLLDIAELASRLKIPAKTIRNKLCDGTWPIRPVRIGRAVRWRESDVERVIADLAAPKSDAPEVGRSLKTSVRRKA
jgi:predicted DNA-binding transcriptional regulator AlpA